MDLTKPCWIENETVGSILVKTFGMPVLISDEVICAYVTQEKLRDCSGILL